MTNTRIGRLLAALLLIPALSTFLIGVSPASAAIDVSVTTPAGNRYRPGKDLALLVTVAADRATNGTVTVSYDGLITAATAFDLPGGAEKTIVVVTPTPQWNNIPQVTVDTGDGSETTRPNLVAVVDEELVGVLPELAARQFPETADAVAEMGQARLYEIQPVLLDAGTSALDGFGSIVAMESDLTTLTADHANALWDWVARGGNLYLDASSRDSLDQLLPFEQTPDSRQSWGFGTVRFTDAELVAGGFESLIVPTGSNNPETFPNEFGNDGPDIQLAADAGLKIPGIGLLLGIIGAYILLVGPLMWLVLKRTNREPLLWLASPVVAAITVAGVFGAGRAQRSAVQASHATIVADVNGSYITLSHNLVATAGGGFVGIKLPEGWVPAASADRRFDEFGNRNQSATVQDGILGQRLPPGGAAVVSTQGPTTNGAPAWAHSLRLTEGELRGSVTNLTSHRLEDVSVSLGDSVRRVDDLGPGETADVALDGDLAAFPRLQDRLMGPLLGNEWQPNERPVSGGALARWNQRFPDTRTAGQVVILGWTRAADGPVQTSSGGTVVNGRTAFMSVFNAKPATQDVPSGSTLVQVVRGPDGTTLIDGRNDFRGGEFASTLAYRLPEGSDTSNLVMEIPQTVSGMDVWTGSKWEGANGVNGRGGGINAVISLPDGSVVNDEVYIRLSLNDFFWGRSDVFPVVRSALAGDEVAEFASE